MKPGRPIIIVDCTDAGRSTSTILIPFSGRLGFETAGSGCLVAIHDPNARVRMLRASAAVMSPTIRTVAAEGTYIDFAQFRTSSRVSDVSVWRVPPGLRENGAVGSNAAL